MLQLRNFLLLLGILSHSVWAQDPDFEALTREAFEIYPASIEFSMPQIERIDSVTLGRWVCRGSCRQGDLEIKGVYHEGVIYLSNSLSSWTVWEQSMYVHEVVHYLQDLAGRTKMPEGYTCAQHVELETEAYTLQNNWLKRRNKRFGQQRLLEMVTASVGPGCKKVIDTLSN